LIDRSALLEIAMFEDRQEEEYSDNGLIQKRVNKRKYQPFDFA
jgi:hypothetical protein